ncbi:MAG: Hsp20/alpha crystallin family protein [Candidatus Lokiarchaeota archaeon]|nr:Hsp20/alpha crystallin family protein [Candidatus Lokiarchaeota archaeon]
MHDTPPNGPCFTNHPRHHAGCMPPVHLGLAFGKEILREVIGNLKCCDGLPTPYDLAETDDEYILTMPLPGFEAKDITVSVKGNDVLIEAERKADAPKDEAPAPAKPRPIITMGEYTWNRPRIEAKIPVKDEIDPENVKARLDRGILAVRFKKKPAAKIAVAE